MGSAYGELRASKHMARDLENTADLRRVQAKDARQEGQQGAQQLIRQGRQLKGKQRTSYAGQNVKVNSGSARRVQEDTDRMVAADVERVKNAAARKAWSFEYDAKLLEDRAKFERRSGMTRAFTSLLSEASQWYGLGSGAGWFDKANTNGQLPLSNAQDGSSRFYGHNM